MSDANQESEGQPESAGIKTALQMAEVDRVMCPHCAKRFETGSYVIDVFRALSELLKSKPNLSIKVDNFGTFSSGEFQGGPDCKQAYFQAFARTFRHIKFVTSRSTVHRMSTRGAPRNPVQQIRAEEKRKAAAARKAEKLKNKLARKNEDSEQPQTDELQD